MEINDYINKLKKIIYNSISKAKFENALVALKILSTIYYDYNQQYIDCELEEELLQIKKRLLKNESYEVEDNCIFFYDG